MEENHLILFPLSPPFVLSIDCSNQTEPSKSELSIPCDCYEEWQSKIWKIFTKQQYFNNNNNRFLITPQDGREWGRVRELFLFNPNFKFKFVFFSFRLAFSMFCAFVFNCSCWSSNVRLGGEAGESQTNKISLFLREINTIIGLFDDEGMTWARMLVFVCWRRTFRLND